MLCVLILYISVGTYSLNSIPNDRIFEKLFMAILFEYRVLARNLLRGNRRRNNYILFRCLAWGLNPGFMSNKPTLYLLDYGDLRHSFAINSIGGYIWLCKVKEIYLNYLEDFENQLQCSIDIRGQPNLYNYSLQPCSEDYNQASHTTHDMCVNFLLQFNGDSER